MCAVDYFMFDRVALIDYGDITILLQVIYLETGESKVKIFVASCILMHCVIILAIEYCKGLVCRIAQP